MNELKFLEEQGVSSSLINKIVKFREVYPVSDEVKNRIIKPAIPFYGKDILEMAIAGILQGQNLLLTGPKATGKNILAENGAISVLMRYGIPSYTCSCTSTFISECFVFPLYSSQSLLISSFSVTFLSYPKEKLLQY